MCAASAMSRWIRHAVWPDGLNTNLLQVPRRATQPTTSHGVHCFASVCRHRRPEAGRLHRDVTHRYGKTVALDGISLDIPSGLMVGIIGPDGVGKSTLMALIAGSKKLQQGNVDVLGGDIADVRHRRNVCPRIAYMPQGLGQESLSRAQRLRQRRLHGAALRALAQPSARSASSNCSRPPDWARSRDRPAGKLSGGMKQKVGLCGALVHDPDLLILDEPTTGVDPLSRRQFWTLIDDIRADRPEHERGRRHRLHGRGPAVGLDRGDGRRARCWRPARRPS